MSSKFSLLASAIPTFTKKDTVEAKVDALTDYQVQLLEYLRYTLSNLDADNFNPSGLQEILEPVVLEIKDAEGEYATMVATVEGFQTTVQGYEKTVDGYTKQVSSFNQTVEGFSTKVSNYEDEVGGYSEQVSEFNQTVKGFNVTVSNYANAVNGYSQQVSIFNQTASEIAACVSAVEDETGKVTAASIVAAINATTGSSMVKIEADHILMTGTTKFVSEADLGAGGTTEIDGGRIVSGVIEGIELRTSGGKLETIRIVDNEIEFGGQASIYKVPSEEADEFEPSYEEGVHFESVTPVFVGSRNGPTNIIAGNSRERVYYTFTASAIYVHDESKTMIGRIPIEWE